MAAVSFEVAVPRPLAFLGLKSCKVDDWEINTFSAMIIARNCSLRIAQPVAGALRARRWLLLSGVSAARSFGGRGGGSAFCAPGRG